MFSYSSLLFLRINSIFYEQKLNFKQFLASSRINEALPVNNHMMLYNISLYQKQKKGLVLWYVPE